MQSKTSRGVRHLLVSTGVISLVLSVAAPGALADAHQAKGKSEEKTEQGGHADNESTGTKRVLVCHKGAVLEVDDDGGDLGGHLKHGDAPLGPAVEEIGVDLQPLIDGCTRTPGGKILDGDLVVDVCRDGVLVVVLEPDLLASDVDPVLNEDDEPTCPGGTIVGGDETTVCVEGVLTEVVEVPEGAVPAVESDDGLTCPGEIIVGGGDKVGLCHEGAVIEIAAGALEEHLAHGDTTPTGEAALGAECGDTKVIVKKPVVLGDAVVLDDEPVVVEVPVKTPPAEPVPPADTPRPVIIISSDTVTKPVTPAKPQVENEVLGAVTTRNPTPGLGALDPGAQTAGSITALAATGSGSTPVLVVVGLVLLLAGFGLQVGARRQVRSSGLAA